MNVNSSYDETRKIVDSKRENRNNSFHNFQMNRSTNDNLRECHI